MPGLPANPNAPLEERGMSDVTLSLPARVADVSMLLACVALAICQV